MKRFILGIFLFIEIGSGLELLLLEHFEDIWQLVPLCLMGASLPGILWIQMSKSRLSIQVFRALMGLFVLGGILGLGLHFNGNMEFELEMYPHMTGVELVWESLKGATPALAPGTMVALGLMGWGYTWDLSSNQPSPPTDELP